MATWWWLAAGLAMVLGLAGCAQPTPYQPAVDGFGYSEQQIETNRFRVSFAGNAVTPRDTVQNYLLYRAAELTLATGHDHFTLVDQSVERSTRYRGSSFGYGSPYGYGRGGGAFGSSTYTAYPIDDYTAYADIVVGQGEKPGDSVDAYDAQDVIAKLGPTVARPGQ